MKRLWWILLILLLLLAIPVASSAYNVTDYAFAKLASGGIPDADTTGDTFQISNYATTGTFPTGNFIVTVFDANCGSPSMCTHREQILISSRTGSTFTIETRNFNGTTHSGDWPIDAKIELAYVSAIVNNVQQQLDDLSAGKQDTLTLSDIVTIINTAVPRFVWTVYGGSTDGGTTPDSTTQASIDALTTAGVPSENIRWLYTAGLTFVVADVTSPTTGEDVVMTLAGGVLDIADLTAATSIEDVVLLNNYHFDIADLTVGTANEDVVLTFAGGLMPAIADLTVGTVNEDVVLESGGPTLHTFYITAAAQDGGIWWDKDYGTGTTEWNTAHDDTTGAGVDDSGTYCTIGTDVEDDGNQYYAIGRCFFSFDTSSIPGGATVTAVTLHVYESALDGSDLNFYVQNGTQASTLTVNDYDNCAPSGCSAVSGTVGNAAQTTGWISFSLSTSAVTPGTSPTKFVIRTSKDYNDVMPISYYLTGHLDTYGSGHTPYLEVTY